MTQFPPNETVFLTATVGAARKSFPHFNEGGIREDEAAHHVPERMMDLTRRLAGWGGTGSAKEGVAPWGERRVSR
jgi:hypothetical protein